MEDLVSFLAGKHDVVDAGTAILALLISFLSIVLTVCSLVQQRSHNRRSVLPIAHISVGDYEDHIFVRLRNNGVGPMIIDRLFVTHRGPDNDAKLGLIDLMPDLPDEYCWSAFAGDISGSAITADNYLTLLSLEGDPQDKKFINVRQEVRRALADLDVEVRYKNVYGEQMPNVSRSLTWFGRNIEVERSSKRRTSKS